MERSASDKPDDLGKATHHLTVWHTVPVGVFLTNAAQEVILANPSFLRMLGYERADEVLGRPLPARHWANPASEQAIEAERRTHGVVRARVVELRDRDNAPVFVSFSAVPTLNEAGEILGAQHILCDLTEQKRLEGDLYRQNAGLVALTAMAETAAATLDVDELVAATLECVLTAFHLDAGAIYLHDQATGSLQLATMRGLAPLGQAVSPGLPSLDGFIAGVLAGRQSILVTSSAADHAARSAIEGLGVESLAVTRLHARGIVYGALVIASRSPRSLDEGDLRLLERLANQAGIGIANASLYHDLQRAYEELQSAQERLIEAERQKVAIQMAGAAAHELNQPLTVIIGYTSILLQRSGEDDPEYPILATLERNARKISDIVRRLSQITRYKTRTYAHDDAILDLGPEATS